MKNNKLKIKLQITIQLYESTDNRVNRQRQYKLTYANNKR